MMLSFYSTLKTTADNLFTFQFSLKIHNNNTCNYSICKKKKIWKGLFSWNILSLCICTIVDVYLSYIVTSEPFLPYCDYETWKNGHLILRATLWRIIKKIKFPHKIQIGPLKNIIILDSSWLSSCLSPKNQNSFHSLLEFLTHLNVKLLYFPGVIQCFVPNQPP